MTTHTTMQLDKVGLDCSVAESKVYPFLKCITDQAIFRKLTLSLVFNIWWIMLLISLKLISCHQSMLLFLDSRLFCNQAIFRKLTLILVSNVWWIMLLISLKLISCHQSMLLFLDSELFCFFELRFACLLTSSLCYFISSIMYPRTIFASIDRSLPVFWSFKHFSTCDPLGVKFIQVLISLLLYACMQPPIVQGFIIQMLGC